MQNFSVSSDYLFCVLVFVKLIIKDASFIQMYALNAVMQVCSDQFCSSVFTSFIVKLLISSLTFFSFRIGIYTRTSSVPFQITAVHYNMSDYCH